MEQGGMNFLQSKMLQQVTPEELAQQQEQNEKKLEKDFQDFIKEYNVPIEIKNVIPPKKEEKEQAIKLTEAVDKIKNDLSPMIKELLIFPQQYIFEDNITDPGQDKPIRDRLIETRLKKLSMDQNERNSNPRIEFEGEVQPKIKREMYHQMWKKYEQNKLHRKQMVNSLNVYMFLEAEGIKLQPETQKLFEELNNDFTPVKVIRENVKIPKKDEGGNKIFENGQVVFEEKLGTEEHMLPAYDFMDVEKKKKVTDTASQFFLALATDYVNHFNNVQ